MATAPALKSTPPVRPWQNLNTLQTLWASLYVVWVLDALLLIAAVTGAHVHRGAMQTIGKDSAPSIIAAQHIKSALADMDADVANDLLGKPGEMQNEAKAYQRRRIEAAKELIAAARNITYGDAEEAPIEAIQVNLGTYEAMVQQARDLHFLGNPGYVAAYRSAARIMDESLLPEADKLDQANHDVLQRTYSEQSGRSILTIVFLLLVGAALLAALVAIQGFLNKKMRRILNPMLVLATSLALGFMLYSFGLLGAERHDLKVAKEDAFESIHALWRARAVAYAANTDESRYLLDVQHAGEHERKFQEKVAALAKLPAGKSFADYTGVPPITGYLADELNNITFEGERDAAMQTVARFADYLSIDSQIRALQQSGQRTEAITLCIGRDQGESNWAFDQFDLAIGRTLDINQTAFDLAVTRGFSTLSYYEIKATIVAVVIAVLAFFGLLKRIQEYR